MDPHLQRRIQKLPQRAEEVWQGGSTCLRTWVTPPGEEPYRPWLVLWVSATDSLVLGQIIEETEPTLQQVWDSLIQAMRRPLAGSPHRPAEVQVRSPDLAASLREPLLALGIRCVCCGELGEFDHILTELERAIGGGEAVPGHLSVPGVTAALVGSLFQAAAEFYRRAPWRYISDRVPIAVQTSDWSEEPWYAVVMGQGGLTYGLALHQSLELLKRMYWGELSDAQAGLAMEALSLTFGDITEMSFEDLEALEENGWEVAGPEAFPFFYRIDPGLAARRPLPQEIDLMEACLRALPDFIERHRPELQSAQPVAEEVTVPLTSGEMALHLSTVQIQQRRPSRPARRPTRRPRRRRGERNG